MRFVAKKAVAALSGQHDIASILIRHGIFSQPIVVSSLQNIQVSITHSEEFGAALAFPEEHPLGIDVEKIKFSKKEMLENQMTATEKERIGFWPFPYETCLTLLWTAKEALSKVLKTGYQLAHLKEKNIYFLIKKMEDFVNFRLRKKQNNLFNFQ